MSTESNQNFLFGSEINPPLGWRGYATSMAVHVGIVVLLLLIPVAVTQEGRQRMRDMATLIAPQLKPYKPPPPKVRPPRVLAKSVIVPKPAPEAKLIVPPPPVAKQEPKPVERPQIAAAEPKPVPRIATPEPAPAPALRPQVHTGVFGSEEAAKKVEAPKQLAVGGFGDPNGAKANPANNQPTLLAKVGAFEMPQGDGSAGGRGGQGRGVVRTTSFGTAEGAGSGPGGNGVGIGHGTVRTAGFGSPEGGNGNGTGNRSGSVKTGGFGDNSTAVQAEAVKRQAAAPATTPVEIISKPKPVYTQEARDLHLEGEVSLEVVFSASGAVQVVRVVRGLGHGLDQAAQQAAGQIRFRPGTRDGVPVDTRATIHIVFELT
ncbi:MAG: energy transducer TonB [Bryobacteraceae bacterium]